MSSRDRLKSYIKLEASRYHEERGEIRDLTVFIKEAQMYWKQFAEATKHGTTRAELVEKLAKQAKKRRFLGFFK